MEQSSRSSILESSFSGYHLSSWEHSGPSPICSTGNECIAIEDLSADVDENHQIVRRRCCSWTGHQWFTLVTCMFAQFGCAVCVSLQAPFFPAEAARKGIRPTIYGFVFGAFSFTVFLVAPFLGKYIGHIGTRFLLNSGIFVTSSCCVLFGILDKVKSADSFIALAFIVRIVEAVGDAAFSTACFTVLAQCFPGQVGVAFSLVRASFSVGLIVGPTIGGILYQLGGYSLPFAVMGAILFTISIVIFILFWNYADESTSVAKEQSLSKVLRISPILLSMVAVCSAAISIGFLSATLEPHLRQFNLSPVEMGGMFVFGGIAFVCTNCIWGRLSDGKVHPRILIATGAFFLSITYIFIGPAPFISSKTQIWMCIVGLLFHGAGLGGELLASQTGAIRVAIQNGFPENFQTYGMISGIWAAAFQLGNFIGPSIGGILLDVIGFRNASLVIFLLHVLVFFVTLGFYFVCERKSAVVNEKTPLVANGNLK